SCGPRRRRRCNRLAAPRHPDPEKPSLQSSVYSSPHPANRLGVAHTRIFGRVPLAAFGATVSRSISNTIAETLRPANESRRGWLPESLKEETRSPFWPGAAKVFNSALKPSKSKKKGSLRRPANALPLCPEKTCSMKPENFPLPPGTFSSCSVHCPELFLPKRAYIWKSGMLSKLPEASARSMLYVN